MKKTLVYIGITLIIIFAVIGLAFTGVYFAMQFGLTNVRGTIEERNSFFESVPDSHINSVISTTTAVVEPNGNDCLETLLQSPTCDWNNTKQWQVVGGGLLKDQDIIKRVATETGVSPRMIVAAVVPEQVRFFTDNREVFKRYFEPLKILASLSKFSLGVSGIKQKTAEEIERNASDPASPFYPGDGVAALFAYSSSITNRSETLFNRLTDDNDHYYSYLYTALYLKEITAQWQKAGFDVRARPDVLVTLFNLGFAASEPKNNPQVAGAPINIGGRTYSFGELGAAFYYSEDLRTEFPN